MSKPLGIGLAGLGTVGSALVHHLHQHADRIAARKDRPLVLRAVSARNRERKPPLPLGGAVFVEQAADLAAREDVDVVVELIGGAQGPACELVAAALNNGKHVVTANKALLARQGCELAAMAEAKGTALLFEAACAAALPAVKVLRETCAISPIEALIGILNGTSNHILCEMEATGCAFEDALADAQARGYAEADPALDINGQDAAQKLVLLGALAFGAAPDENAAEVEGIRAISPLDIHLAEELGYKLRLIAHAARIESGGASFRVRPALVLRSNAIATERGSGNALAIHSPSFGTLILQGQGAGGAATASAVAADLADLAAGRWPRYPFGMPAANLTPSSLSAPAPDGEAFYIRVLARDEAGSMAEIAHAAGEAGLSLARMIQPDVSKENQRHLPPGFAPVAMITHPAAAASIAQARRLLDACGKVSAPAVLYPVEE